MHRILKKSVKVMWQLVFFVFAATLFSLFAHAAAPNLQVVFTPNPLFSEIDFLPGSVATGTVAVTNNSTTTHDIITEGINVKDAGGLGEALILTISDGAGPLYTDMLAHFLRGGEVLLSTLTRASAKTYTFVISFNTNAPDVVQGATLGFDLCVGFQGGNRSCGDTVISNEQDINNGAPGGDGGTLPGTGGGGGGFVSPPPPGGLVISSIQAYATTDLLPGQVRIVWDTNYLSTSQVAYGLSPGPYSIDVNDPNFGYPLGTVKDSNKVEHHSVVISGLTIGATYLYRVVSTASPPTVSFEHSFTLTGASQGGGSLALADVAGGIAQDSENINAIHTEGQGNSLQKRQSTRVGASTRNRSVGGTGGSVSSLVRGNIEENTATTTFSSMAGSPEPVVPPKETEDGVLQGNGNVAATFFSNLFDGYAWIFALLAVLFLFLLVYMRRKAENE